MVAFLAACAAQYAIYRRFLSADLRSPDLAVRQAALKRWLKITLAWQGVEVVLVLAWVVPFLLSHAGKGLWILPAAGLLLGTAVAFQPVLARIARALRP